MTATVEESCRLDVRPMAFGPRAESHGSPEAQTSLMLSCTAATSYVATMDNGKNGDGSARRMANAAGTRFVAYDIFSDAARTRRWDASSGGAVSAVAPADGRVELAVYPISRKLDNFGPRGATTAMTVPAQVGRPQ